MFLTFENIFQTFKLWTQEKRPRGRECQFRFLFKLSHHWCHGLLEHSVLAGVIHKNKAFTTPQCRLLLPPHGLQKKKETRVIYQDMFYHFQDLRSVARVALVYWAVVQQPGLAAAQQALQQASGLERSSNNNRRLGCNNHSRVCLALAPPPQLLRALLSHSNYRNRPSEINAGKRPDPSLLSPLYLFYLKLNKLLRQRSYHQGLKPHTPPLARKEVKCAGKFFSPHLKLWQAEQLI